MFQQIGFKRHELRLLKKRLRDSFFGQTIIESTFGIIVLVLLMLGMIRVFFWVGADLSSRRAAHEQTLVSPVRLGVNSDYYRQIRPVFYEGIPMDATTVNSEIFGTNRFR